MKKRAVALLGKIDLEPLARIQAEGFTDVGLYLPDLSLTDAAEYQRLLAAGDEMDRVVAQRELRLVIFTGYMRYNDALGKKEPQRRMVNNTGTSMPTLCPFRPENKDWYIRFLERLCQWPSLREIHLNDESTLDLDVCYCDFCQARFEQRHGRRPPKAVDWNSPLWWDWVNDRIRWWIEVHAEFRARIKARRPEIQVGLQQGSLGSFGGNAGHSLLDLGWEAETQDLISIDPYHAWHSLGTYLSIRRYLTEGTRLTRGATVDKWTNVYPQAFMPPGASMEMNKRDGVLAGVVPFGLGVDSIVPYRYDYLQAIPGYAEGLQESRRLWPYLERTRPWTFVTVIYPSQSEIYGRAAEPQWVRQHIYPWPYDTMRQTGFTWRWLFDSRMIPELKQAAGVLIVPDAHCLTAEQRETLRDFQRRGGGILWVGETPGQAWTPRTPLTPAGHELGTNLEIKLVNSHHPCLSGIQRPIVLWNAIARPPDWMTGPALAQAGDKPALIVNETGSSREAWLAGCPKRRPGTDGIALLVNLLRWLAPAPPLAELDPWPPPNAYGRLCPGDGRDVPTMELFPLVGERLLVAPLFNYLGLAYQTRLIIRVPDGRRPRLVRELVTDQDVAGTTGFKDGMLQIPLDVQGEEIWRAYVVEW